MGTAQKKTTCEIAPDREDLSSSGFGVLLLREGKADVMVAQPMYVLVIICSLILYHLKMSFWSKVVVC
jgi:hypothetical protein